MPSGVVAVDLGHRAGQPRRLDARQLRHGAVGVDAHGMRCRGVGAANGVEHVPGRGGYVAVGVVIERQLRDRAVGHVDPEDRHATILVGGDDQRGPVV